MISRSVTVAVLAGLALGTGAALASSAPIPLSQRALHAGDFLGLNPVGTTAVTRSASQWARTFASPTTTASLREVGFVGGLPERLHWEGNDVDGLSVTTQLDSPSHARAYMKRIYADDPSQPRFPVTGIPGAIGFGTISGGQGGINVVFADGAFVYLVGAGWGPDASRPPTKAQLTAAARLLYNRVHGHPSG